MSRLITLVAWALASCVTLPAEPRWVRTQTENFEIYSTASEKSIRDTLAQFEQVRDFFQKLLGRSDGRSTPIRVVAFSSAKEYEPYRLNESAIAYFGEGPERETIVMSRLGEEEFHVAAHEYIHALVRRAGLRPPLWLNEGLAEFYSTLRPLGGKVIVGEIMPGRRNALLHEKWVPLSIILSVDHKSPYYNEKNKAGSFYNESWGLCHMLITTQEYRPGLAAVMKALDQGKTSDEALATAYGKPVNAIDADLQRYLRGNRFVAGEFPGKLINEKQPASVEPAPAFDVKVILADLAYHPGEHKEDEARKLLAALISEEPSRPEPWALQGYLELQQGHAAAAAECFEKAFALGGRGPRMLWDYGQMLLASRPKDAVRVFNELVAIEPKRMDARIELAAAQLQDGQPLAAGQILTSIMKSVSPAEAPRFLVIGAYVDLAQGQRDAAQTVVERLRQVAATDQDRTALAELERRLAQPEPNAGITPDRK